MEVCGRWKCAKSVRVEVYQRWASMYQLVGMSHTMGVLRAGRKLRMCG